MAIPDPIETFMLRLGFDYSPVKRRADVDAPPSGEHEPVWSHTFSYIADDTPILAVVASDCRIEPEALRRAAGASALRPATADEMADYYPESEPGAIPPLGPFYGQRVFVDEGVSHHQQLVFDGGTSDDAIQMRYGDFAELVHPTVGHFAKPA